MNISEENNLIVDQKYVYERIDKFIAEKLPDNSRAYYQRLIKNGSVTLNSEICKTPKRTVQLDDVIVVKFVQEEVEELVAEDIPLDVIFEDEYIIVINKPPGLVVHPAPGNWTGTVVNALLGRNKNFADELCTEQMRPGIVHRLDKDTSGCLVVAKNPQAHYKMAELFSDRKVEKSYAAISYGSPRFSKKEITTLIGRHIRNRKKMAVVQRNGKEAVTICEVLKRGNIDNYPIALLNVNILTGRTHQIRVHVAHMNTPILGDTLYGGNQKIEAPRQMLHAWKISFPHPITGKKMKFEAPFPDDFNSFVKQLETE